MYRKNNLLNFEEAELLVITKTPLHFGLKLKRLTPKNGGLKASSLNYHQFEVGGYSKPHYHKNMEHIMYFVKGKGILTLGNEEIPVKEGSIVALPVNIPHSVKNTGDNPFGYLIFSNAIPVKGETINPDTIRGIPVDE
jgi:quercetin dioxygenase-like cupin family protein